MVSTGRSHAQAVLSILGVVGLAVVVPLFFVLLPLALMYRLVLEVAAWPDWLPRVGAVRVASPTH